MAGQQQQTCFKCGEPIFFQKGVTNKFGKPERFNQDGSLHWQSCTARQQNQQQQQPQAQSTTPKPAQQHSQSTISPSEVNGLSLQLAGISDLLLEMKIEINKKLDTLISLVKAQPTGYTDFEPPT